MDLNYVLIGVAVLAVVLFLRNNLGGRKGKLPTLSRSGFTSTFRVMGEDAADRILEEKMGVFRAAETARQMAQAMGLEVAPAAPAAPAAPPKEAEAPKS